MRLTIQGALLFLFIPLVLFLYLRQPLGPGVSIVVGLVIMFGHRFVAAPWMARHATQRCLWCGCRLRSTSLPGAPPRTGPAQDFGPAIATKDSSPAIRVISGRTEQVMVACRRRHRDDIARFLTFVTRYRAPIAIGIFVPLALLLAGSLAQAAGYTLLTHDWNTWQFRTVVAFTVVVVSLAYRAVSFSTGPVRSPFPLHNFFLLGIRNTLWVFRGVGAWWLAVGALYLLSR